MRMDADVQGPKITASGDKRITPLGSILRKTKFDEAPQLWNILKGEMSFVGPRPEVPKYVALYNEKQKVVLQLKPGLTDEASIAFRDEELLLSKAKDPERFYIEQCLPKKIELNLNYATRSGVWHDCIVMVKTVRSVLLRN